MSVPSTNSLKIIVGVDYGTTYSGVAFVTKLGPRDTDTPESILRWPGDAGFSYHKVPSRIAYPKDNKGNDYEFTRSSWGYEVEAGWQSYTWTKLLLDRNTPLTEWDDPDLEVEQARLNQGILKVPEGKKPVDVTSDYLKHLYDHIIHELKKCYPAAILRTTPIEFWFTHPAIWSPEAKNATRTAAENAGFGRRSDLNDTVNLISEPEAAAIAALRSPDDKQHSLKKDSGIMICDLGGGTVDITTYRVRQIPCPQIHAPLKVDEACTGEGAKCGSTMIDRKFQALMKRVFGNAFTELPAGKTGPGSRFMHEFETLKKGFDGRTHHRYQLKLKMPGLKRDQGFVSRYDWDDNEIKLTGNDMKECFDPVIDRIIELLESQLAAVKARKSAQIETIILVGGFADSAYLWDRILEWRDLYYEGIIDVITPKKSIWSAIARGAALRGLDGTLVLRRQCRRHYGISTSKQWDPHRDRNDPDHKTWICGRTGERWTYDCMYWFLRKDVELISGTEVSFAHIEFLSEDEILQKSQHEMEIFSCPLPSAPEKRDRGTVQKLGTVGLNLREVNLTECASWNDQRSKVYEINLHTYVIPEGTETGKMDLRVVWKDRNKRERPCGTAKLKFTAD